jgi:enoyl-CoA hydratase
MKLIVNQTYENMGLHSAQTLGPILDGLMRNTPEAHAFIDRAAAEGVKAATQDRDARFGDYSAAGAERRPEPGHVIEPA